MSNRYFVSVKDEDLLPYAIDKFESFRKRLLDYLSLPDSGNSLSSLLSMMDYTPVGKQFLMNEEVFRRYDTTMLVCLNLDREHGAGYAYDFFSDMHIENIEGNVTFSGLGVFWNSLLIKEERKSDYIAQFLSDFSLDFRCFRGVDYEDEDCDAISISSLFHMSSIMNDICLDAHLFSGIDESIRRLASKDFLDNLDPYEIGIMIEDAYNALLDNLELEGKDNEDEIIERDLFFWLKSLCHKGVMEGYHTEFILGIAKSGISKILDKFDIEEQESRVILERRGLANIAYGFEHLMREIGYEKKDVMPVCMLFNDSISKESINYYEYIDIKIMGNPTVNRQPCDRYSFVYNETHALESMGINLRPEDLLAIESKNDFRPSLLGGRISLGDDVWKEVIKHPDFIKIDNILLTEFDYVLKEADPHLFVAWAKREMEGKKGLINMPKAWSEKDKKEILELMSADKMLSDHIIHYLGCNGFESQDFNPYMKEISAKAKKEMITTDMGL